MKLYRLLGLVIIFVSCSAAIAEEQALNEEEALKAAIYRYLYFRTGTVPVSPQPVSFGAGLENVAKPGETVWEVRFTTPDWTEDILFINPRTGEACVAHWGKDWESRKHEVEKCTPVTYKGFPTE